MDKKPKLFEEGDKVRLKTGGPIMTVQAAPDHMAYCVWFVGDKPHQGTFDQETIELVMPKTRLADAPRPPLH